jgi:adenine-specific DNA-methyltransferase
LYFAAGYLSLQQAVEADAIRFAIDKQFETEERDWLLASWISAISVLVNAPGHTAQYLKPNTESAYARIVRTWARSVWEEFHVALTRIVPLGTKAWRASNTVLVGDALDLVATSQLRGVGAVYADPPYTKDQYSRYYHMYETLYLYDYPGSFGVGRNRPDRFTTSFSLKSCVVAAFHDLCRNTARLGVPLVLSYPAEGLLSVAGAAIPEVANLYFDSVQVSSFEIGHSTMGASTGKSKKIATENIYVCRP